MNRFPSPISLPDYVFNAREERSRQVIASAKIGIAIRLTIILAELVGVWLFASSALLLDALSSLFDVLFSVSLIFCIKLAGRPPDKNHPFGHGRFEPLMGLQLGLVLVLLGVLLFFQQIFQLTEESSGQIMNPHAWMIPTAAVFLLEISYRVVMHTAKQQNSLALAADATHYRIDALTSFFAALALLLAAYFPNWSLMIDHLGAVFIALLMIGLGFYAARSNLHQVMDHVPEQAYFDRVQKAAFAVSGVLGTEKIRIQLYGPDAHVDIDIEVQPELSVHDAHEISQKVRAEIQKDWPAVQDVTVHIEPFYPNDH
jgi:cation diffusion facilitator family transporter